MASSDARSFTEELNAIINVLGNASLMASSLSTLHEAELQQATDELTVKNGELINLNTELQAQLGQVSPSPHPFSCESDKTATDTATKQVREDIDSPSDSICSEQGSDGKQQEGESPPEANVDLPVLGPASPAEVPLQIANSRESRRTEVDAQGAKSLQSTKTGDQRGVIPAVKVALRPCWESTNMEAKDVIATRFSVKVAQSRSLGRSPSAGLGMGPLSSRQSQVKETLAGLACFYCRNCQIMHPVGQLRMGWNAVCLIFIGYDLMIVPLQVFDVENVSALQYCEWLLTIWWTLDVIMTFRTGYFIGSRIEMRARQIAYHYMRTWLLCDMIIVTLEWVNRFAVMVGSASLMRSSRAFRTLRFMKLFRITKATMFWKALQEQINSNVIHLFCTITVLCGVLVFTVHFVSCIWYAVGDSRDDGWVLAEKYSGKKTILFWYVASSRWVISQFNGRTDLNEHSNMVERLFTCIVGVFLAVLAHAVFISVITKTMLDLSELVSEKTRRRRFVNEYLEYNPLPPILTAQVKRCLVDYQDVTHEAQKEAKVLAILPQHVQAEVLYEVRAPVLMDNSFFHGLRYESPWAMRFVCRKVVESVSATKYEVVFDKGDVCTRILFTNKLTATYGEPSEKSNPNQGRLDSIVGMSYTSDLVVERQNSSKSRIPFLKKAKTQDQSIFQFVQHAQGCEAKSVMSGCWVSEAALWTEWRNQGRLISNGHGFLLSIQALELAQAVKKHPDAFALASLYGSKLVEELGKASELSDVLPFDVRLVSPIRVSVTILSATGLYNADGFLSGKSDPYCVCNVLGMAAHRDSRFKTDIKYDTLDPVWNHRAEVGLTRHQSLEFQVWDYDFGKSDTELGIARLYPDDYYPDGFQGDLELNGANGRGQGSIKVSIEVLEWEEEVHAWKTLGGSSHGGSEKSHGTSGRRFSKSSAKTSTRNSFLAVLAQ